MNVLLEMWNNTARFIDATVIQQKRASVRTLERLNGRGKMLFCRMNSGENAASSEGLHK